jgi:integrase
MVIQMGSRDSRSATLIIRSKAADGTWRRAPIAKAANGRIRPGYAIVDGQSAQTDQFLYQVRYYENRKLKYRNAGKNASDAETLRRRIEAQTTVRADAIKAGLKVEADEDRRTISGSAAAYIRDAEQRGALEAAAQARSVTAEFSKLSRRTYVDEVTRDDIFRFHTALRKRGCAERTVANKHQRLASWLRFAGIDASILPPTPKYEEALPTIYTSDELSTLLAAASSYMHIAVLLGLKCGLRDQELMHAEFSDINVNEKTLRVRGKPKWGFRVKTHEQRDIPLPGDVLTEILQWKKERSGHTLILDTESHRPNQKLLRNLKALAREAKMNCGRCGGCRSKHRECQEFTLHKLRRTYITTLLRNGIDLRTVQAYAGHKDIASTMRYLRPASAKEAQGKLNAILW